MKKLLALSMLAIMLVVAGCGDKQAAATSSASQPSAANTVQRAPQAQSTAQGAKVSMQVAGKNVTIALADNAAAQRLLTQLPAELSFSDFNHTEKIAYPKEKISVDGAPKGHAPKAGDMCIYVPWGNICIFYHDYKFSSDLVYLGTVEQGLDTLSSQTEDFKVNLAVVK